MKHKSVGRCLSCLCAGMLLYGVYLPLHAVVQFAWNKHLIIALRQGNVLAVHDALAHGAEANARSDVADLRFRQIIALLWRRQGYKGGESALLLAFDWSRQGEDKHKTCSVADPIVQDLLMHGAHVEEKSSHGVTPLMLATGDGCRASIDALVRAGADVNARTDHEVTLLMYAVMSHDERIVKQMLLLGADPNPTLHNQLYPENYIGCTLWTPKEYQGRMEKIYFLVQQARKRLKPDRQSNLIDERRQSKE